MAMLICVEAASRLTFPVAKGTMCTWRIYPSQLAKSRETAWHIWRSEGNATTGYNWIKYVSRSFLVERNLSQVARGLGRSSRFVYIVVLYLHRTHVFARSSNGVNVTIVPQTLGWAEVLWSVFKRWHVRVFLLWVWRNFPQVCTVWQLRWCRLEAFLEPGISGGPTGSERVLRVSGK